MPDAVSAEGDAGEVDTAWIAVVLRDCLVELLHCGVGVLAEPLRVRRELRVDDDGGAGVLAERGPEADFFLPDAVGAALAGSVQIEDDAIQS